MVFVTPHSPLKPWFVILTQVEMSTFTAVDAPHATRGHTEDAIALQLAIDTSLEDDEAASLAAAWPWLDDAGHEADNDDADNDEADNDEADNAAGQEEAHAASTQAQDDDEQPLAAAGALPPGSSRDGVDPEGPRFYGDAGTDLQVEHRLTNARPLEWHVDENSVAYVHSCDMYRLIAQSSDTPRRDEDEELIRLGNISRMYCQGECVLLHRHRLGNCRCEDHRHCLHTRVVDVSSIPPVYVCASNGGDPRNGDDVVAGSESQVIDESTLLHGGAGAELQVDDSSVNGDADSEFHGWQHGWQHGWRHGWQPGWRHGWRQHGGGNMGGTTTTNP